METQQPTIRTDPYAAPIHNLGSSIMFLTNPENELYKMELMLKGKRLDKDGNQIDAGDPLLNELGINSVMGIIQSMVNQVTVMSNLKKDDIPKLIDFLADTLAQDLMINRIQYKMTYAARNKIFFTVLSTTYITLNRALEEGDRRFWKGSVQEIKSTVESNTQKGGIMSKFNPWAR